MESLLKDIRYGVRSFLKRPGFLVIAVSTLALGGKRFHVWRDEKLSREVVGVVGDTKHSLDEQARNQVYVSYAQSPTSSSLTFVVRTAGEPTTVAGQCARRSDLSTRHCRLTT